MKDFISTIFISLILYALLNLIIKAVGVSANLGRLLRGTITVLLSVAAIISLYRFQNVIGFSTQVTILLYVLMVICFIAGGIQIIMGILSADVRNR